MKGRVALLVAFSLPLAACSAVRSVYQMDGYSPAGAGGIKHVALRVWSPAAHQGLAPVMARVAFDFVNQYTNFLVHSKEPMRRGWAEACDDLQGVLTLRATRVVEAPGGVVLEVTAELYRCSDGALVWRADGAGTYAQEDVDLVNLVAVYEQDLGAAARRYAVPVFGLLQDLMRELPSPPDLTEDEILQKIELEVGAAWIHADRPDDKRRIPGLPGQREIETTRQHSAGRLPVF